MEEELLRKGKKRAIKQMEHKIRRGNYLRWGERKPAKEGKEKEKIEEREQRKTKYAVIYA